MIFQSAAHCFWSWRSCLWKYSETPVFQTYGSNLFYEPPLCVAPYLLQAWVGSYTKFVVRFDTALAFRHLPFWKLNPCFRQVNHWGLQALYLFQSPSYEVESTPARQLGCSNGAYYKLWIFDHLYLILQKETKLVFHVLSYILSKHHPRSQLFTQLNHQTSASSLTLIELQNL